MDRGNGQVRLNSLGHGVIIMVILNLSVVKASASIYNLFNWWSSKVNGNVGIFKVSYSYNIIMQTQLASHNLQHHH